VEAPAFLHAVLPNIPPYVSYSWLAMAILISMALVLRGRLSMVPAGLQNVMESVAEFFLTTARSNIGHDWGDKFFPLIGTIGLYIFTCNIMGLIPGFDSPTSNINMTASMAVPVFLATHYYGIKVHKFKYINHFVGPFRSVYAFPAMVFFFILETIGHIARPVTLSVRLFGNMMAKHMILIILAMLVPAIVPVPILILGVLVSVIQAYVFILLTCLYLAGAVEDAH
jgi:F-type H+-transporting ATPase subunit a